MVTAGRRSSQQQSQAGLEVVLGGPGMMWWPCREALTTVTKAGPLR